MTLGDRQGILEVLCTGGCQYPRTCLIHNKSAYKCVLNELKSTKNGGYYVFLSGGFHSSACAIECRIYPLIDFPKHIAVLGIV